jgi:hypothetical protein
VWVGLAMLVLTACTDRAREPAVPGGAWVSGRSAALRAIAERVAGLEGTPVGREARALAASLPECALVDGHAPDGDLAAALGGLACRDPAGPFAALDRERGARDLLFAQPVGSTGELLRGALAVRGDALDLELRWPEAEASGALTLLLPGDDAAGPGVLSSTDRLLSLRVRPADGFHVASLVPAGSQGDQLFALRGRLFAGAVLDGTWEAAAYLPRDGDPLPAMALAVGFRLRAAAVAAADRFVADLEARWPVHRSAFELSGARGACLLDLNILPRFAPCYVATERALVVGWNRDSVRRALSGGSRATDIDAPARLDLDLELFERADEILARHVPGARRRSATRWPWRRVEAEARRDGDALFLRVAFSGGTDGAVR